MKTELHRLLVRQIRRTFGSPENVPAELWPFLEQVNRAYFQNDQDRMLAERSLQLASEELLERNELLEEDIQRREGAEEALRNREARLGALIDALPDDLFVLDPDGNVRGAWRRADSVLDQDPTGANIRDIMPEHLIAPALEHLRRVSDGGEGCSWHFSAKIGGELKMFEARFELERAERVLVMLRDVTETQRMAQQLEISARMASVGILAAGVAHEINNPLTYVLANLETLADQLGELDQQLDFAAGTDILECVSNAWSGATRVSRIVRELKTFSHAGQEELGAVDLHQAIDSAVRIAFPEIRHRARLTKQYCTSTMVYGDSAKLGQVFLNLLVNAAQALPIGRVEQNRITITTTSVGDEIVVTIEDTGPGIPEEIRDRVFEPFYTTKPRGVGTGLGLSICRNIVMAMDGRIELRSSSSAGTTFELRLKAAAARVLPQERRSATPLAHPRGASARVLVVDDEVQVGRSIRRLLKGHQVTLTTCGEEGWSHLLKSDFDIILCDMVMPDMTGDALYERAVSELPGAAERFVFMTGGAFATETQRFLAEPGRICLEKPFDVAELRAIVAQAAVHETGEYDTSQVQREGAA